MSLNFNVCMCVKFVHVYKSRHFCLYGYMFFCIYAVECLYLCLNEYMSESSSNYMHASVTREKDVLKRQFNCLEE